MTDFPKLLTLDETAELLRKTPNALRWQINQGTAPKSGKIGGRRMFRESDVLAYIDAAFEMDDDGSDDDE
ncbi:AlpA family transcriptional regulator [Rathayibacter sp. AY2B9]|uniref:helix-turn-helix transcriptional regulator n=1 Tax=Rathayibacter sp. AY2B9 TaxID=2080572 RepID=UPI000CE8E603|nr:helix-turn-helix domain-containing protein [Rathayibacter sp. AY2B9]PPG34501.1 helix-turn-helix domain-containing protein [Rathayibacter sp. AY2B9]